MYHVKLMGQLFWAIRGGGVNFGVVTTFELKCHPQIPQVFFGELFYTPDKFVRAVELCDQFEKEKMDQKQLILTGIIKTPDGIVRSLLTAFVGVRTDDIDGYGWCIP